TIAALALGGILAGCGGEKPADNEKTDPITKTETNGATPAVFSNDKGVAMCPVMGAPMADTASLKFEDYEGKRYYFCCDECPDKFHADPAKYADGKAMPKESSM
ncbi:MAG: YHS domain-containing protein, partial [Armatimonadota bacterium]|nr:YHS domain-containing protein [Armatimonadota bacterium]